MLWRQTQFWAVSSEVAKSSFTTASRVSCAVYPMLFALPNGLIPNVTLRLWLVDFIHHYPMTDPMMRLRDYIKMNPDKPIRYKGDLEADYIEFLAKVQKAAKENPVDVEFDFP